MQPVSDGRSKLERVSLARRAANLSPTVDASGHSSGIGFDSGHGFPGIFPDLTSSAVRALNEYRAETLQYAERPGMPELRAWIAEYLNSAGATVGADEILVVNGAKHGIELICRTLLDPGDAIVVTAPTYFTVVPLFRSFEVDFIEVGQDNEGLDTDELAVTLDRWVRAGRKPPKFVYNVPEFHNPTGLTMSLHRRQALLALAHQYGTWILEDSPYREIRFEGAPEPSLLALDDQRCVLHVGTFSKLIAPGIRIGWVVGPVEMLARMMQLKSDGGSSPLLQRMIFEWLNQGNLPGHIDLARGAYQAHRDCMVAALHRDLPEIAFKTPGGGYYVWLTLPGGIDGDELARRAADKGVLVIPGSKFYAGSSGGFPNNEGHPRNRLRLTYSYPTEEQINEGVKRLGAVLRSMRN